jgi:hypothetical protein
MKHVLRDFKLLVKLLILVALTQSMISCVTDDDTSDCERPKEKAVVKINIYLQFAQPVLSRASIDESAATALNGSDAAQLPAEQYINNLCIAIFDAAGNRISYNEIDASAQTSPSAPISQTIETNTNAAEILLVANCPKDWFRSKITKSEFLSTPLSLAYTTSDNAQSNTAATTPNSQKQTALPAYASYTLTAPLKPYPQANSDIAIAMKHQLARVYLKSVTEMMNTDASGHDEYKGARFVPTAVFMYHANTSYSLDGTSAAPSFVDAVSDNGDVAYLHSGAISTTAADDAAIANGTALPSLSGKYVFYVFPNSTAAPTKLVIKGNFYEPNAPTTPIEVYYPIRLNVEDGASGEIQNTFNNSTVHNGKLAANQAMSIALAIHGIGTTSAAEDILPASATITWTVNVWNAVYTGTTIPVPSKPNIGDYLYSDGSWGSSATYTDEVYGKHPVALIFSNTPSDIDKKYGFTHGYAVALTDSRANLKWASQLNYNPLTPVNTFKDCYYDKEGYTESLTIMRNGKIGVVPDATFHSNYPGFWYALNFGATTGNPTFEAPAASSGWYMPSIGQLMSIFENLAGQIMTNIKYSTTPFTGGIDIVAYNISTLNDKLTAAPGGQGFATSRINYMSSTPSSVRTRQGNTVLYNFLYMKNAWTAGYYNSGILNSTTAYVRPVLAF